LFAAASYAQNDLLLCVAMAPFGLGCGSAFANATDLILGSVSQDRAATAAATSESAFEFGGVLGIAVLSTLLASDPSAKEDLARLAPRALGVGALAVLTAWVVAYRASNTTASTTRNECSSP